MMNFMFDQVHSMNCKIKLTDVHFQRINNKSLSSQGVFPSRWKEEFIFPIYKPGNKQDITNYRPIA